MLRLALVGFAFALLTGAFACGTPEAQACEDYAAALRACTDRNGPQSGPGEDYDACEAVEPACEAYLRCAAEAPCAEAADSGFFTLDVDGCEAPEGVDCP